MGAAGYALGDIVQQNPRQLAIDCMVAEAATQIFCEFNDHFDWGISGFRTFIFMAMLAGHYRQNRFAIHFARFILGNHNHGY